MSCGCVEGSTRIVEQFSAKCGELKKVVHDYKKHPA